MSNNRQTALCALAGVLLLALVFKFLGSEEGALIRQLQNGPTAQRLEAITQLSLIGSSGALEAIAEHGEDPEDEVARQALLALGRKDWPEGLEALRRALGSPRGVVREAAVTALGRHDRKRVDSSRVVGLLKSDPVPAVRAAAANAAGSLYLWDAMPVLVVSLRHEDARVRGQSAVTIRKLIGVDHGFKSASSRAKREEAIGRIEKVWKDYEPYHHEFMKRLEARGD